MVFYINSKNFALKTIAVFLIFLSYQNNISAQKKPNVIFILSDDVGYDLLSVNGNKSYSTPNIDSMAHHGINFTHCEGMPLCSPSRCMLLTGKYNFRNYSAWGYLNDTAKTFGNVMQDAGYKTGFFGKLQLSLFSTSMANLGFDKYTFFEMMEDSGRTGFRYKSPSLVDNNGFVPDSIVLNNYCDDILTKRIFDFIDSNANNPFFVYYSMSIAHEPFCPTPTDSAYATWNGHSSKSDTRFFPSMIERMDYEVGLIKDKLVKTGLDKNTILIFAGDNGTPDQIHYNVDTLTNVEGRKGHSIERGTHVPLIAYWPSHIKAAQTNDDLIDFTDFLPTFADVAENKNLSRYGIIDGLSFYSRMLGIEGTSKSQLFFHYDAHPGFDSLKRWVRDKTYKLYDSTGGTSFLFYNIKKDGAEKYPLKDENLSPEQKTIKQRFKFLLDSMPNWPDEPVLNNPFVKNITASSAVIGATIVATGSSSLTDRGSNLFEGTRYFCILGFKRLRDTAVATGTFSQNRIDLLSQTLYSYSVYAVNANASHNTGYALGTFYTLSQPPLSQPDYLKACVDTSSVLLNWNSSIFPKSGATKRGYAVFYSTDSIILEDKINGIEPSKIAKNGMLISPASKQVPALPDTFVRVPNLKYNAQYHFLLVPYTWDGTENATYNYLIQDALSIVTQPLHEHFSVSTETTPVCYGEDNGSIKVNVFNGVQPYEFSINSNTYTSDSFFNHLISGQYKIKVKDAAGCVDSQSVSLKSPLQLKLNLIVKDADCAKHGEIIASAKNGFLPYLFSINNGEFDTISDFKNLKPDKYSISVKDSNQCVLSSNVLISQNTKDCFSGIHIFPNPSSSFFTIQIGSDQILNHIKISVYDVLGKLVYSNQGTQIVSYTFGKPLIKGVYLVIIQAGDQKFKYKVLKN